MKVGHKNTEHKASLFLLRILNTYMFIVRTLRAEGLNAKFSLSPAAQAKGSWIQSLESRLLPENRNHVFMSKDFNQNQGSPICITFS